MNPFSTAFIKAPKRSRFDFNHSNTVGIQFGALTPTLSRFIVPGDEVTLSVEQICRLAPMPVPTFVNLKVRHDFFFVPLRLLYGVEYLDKLFGSDTTIARASVQDARTLEMFFGSFFWTYDGSAGVDQTKASNFGGVPFVPGTLMDYLQYPVFTDRNNGLSSAALAALAANDLPSFAAAFQNSPGDGVSSAYAASTMGSKAYCVEPIFAYHFIWRDWYRFTGIQDSNIPEKYLDNGVLAHWINSGSTTVGSFTNGSQVLDIAFPDMAPYIEGATTPNPFYLKDLSYLQYAHLKKDMFTSVRYGSKPTVLIPTGANGTIPALREASAVQRFLDIISITGQRYFDKVKGLFGVESAGPKDDRVQFLARYQQFIKVGEVITTASTAQADTGDYAGRGILIDGKYLFKRRFTEHGWLMCITSVVPDVAYDGSPRQLTDILPLDTPLPSLAQVGDQTVTRGEVFFDYDYSVQKNNRTSIGDQFRFYAYKSAPSEVHGFFKMDTARPWSPVIPAWPSHGNIIYGSKVYPDEWNYLFNDNSDEWVFGDRFFFNIDFYESITRALPKYINYHL